MIGAAAPRRPDDLGPARRILQVRWLGHAAFSICSPGASLLVDPHRPGALGGRFRLPAITGPFDAIACSHGHDDHAAWSPEFGTQRWVESDDRVGDLRISFLATPHDRDGGRRMGLTRMVAIELNGLRIVHSGDLGAVGAREIAFASGCDLLLIAAGGTYTLDGREAAAFCAAAQPRTVVPMHCADPDIDLPLAPVSDFVSALAWPTRSAPAWTSDDADQPPSTVLLLARPLSAPQDPQ